MNKNKIAIFDIDGTIFRKNLHFELINELVWMKIFPISARKKLIDFYTDWLEHQGAYESYRRALVNLYAKHIKGRSREEVEKASRIVVPFHKNRTYVFAENMIKKFKKADYHIIAISGSPVEIVEEFNRLHLKFNKVFGSVYQMDEKDVYTGKAIFEPTKDKGRAVKQYIYENKLTLDNSYGIGDTESDASFLKMVEHPIAFNPNQNLKKISEKNNWRIVVEKKDVIYNIK